MADPNSILEKILSDNKGSASRLPPLRDELSSMQKWWQEVERMIDEFLRFLMPGGRANPADLKALTVLLTGFCYLAIFVAMLLVCIFLYRRLLAATDFQRNSHMLQFPRQQQEVREALDDAIRAGDWPGAMRLRWLLHVLALKIPMSETPLSRTKKRWSEEDALSWYSVMFGRSPGSHDEFTRFSDTLYEGEHT